MTVKQPRLPTLVAATLSVLILQSCDGGGDGGSSPNVNGTYLHISTPDFYFGTKDVGSEVTQNIKIANQGADSYPLKSIGIEGDNAEEFSTDILDGVILNPAESITVGITFKPITDGRKFANFVVDFETVQNVDESVNVNEQNYYQARKLENAGEYGSAKKLYQDYIEGDPVTPNKRTAAIKLPVITESEIYGDGEDFDMYLSALDLRNSGEYEAASNELATINSLYSDGYLGDDALYLTGYIQLMDEKNYSEALRTMQQLRKQYPDSTYYDTALYSEAIAEQELGNTTVAREILLDLRYRHTGIDTLGITMAKDNILSKLWFSRANAALDNFGSA